MDIKVAMKFAAYPEPAKKLFLEVRQLIFEVAEKEKLGDLLETLKWGEPSFLSKKGSTIRVDWKAKDPDKVSIYFNCNTCLIDTFREVYWETLHIVGNREIALPISKGIPVATLEACISMALRYHSIKHLPLLGA